MMQGNIFSGLYSLVSQEEKIKLRREDDPVVALIDAMLFQAIRLHASDIHLQPHENLLRVRYRIDGNLYDQQAVAAQYKPQVISRLKILSALDISERRVPQDGKFKAQVFCDNGSSKIIDFRVSTFPSLYGEKMVIRILDRDYRLLSLEMLGFNENLREKFFPLVRRSTGLLLVTGPTGSGKTTTLYALLGALNKTNKNIVTMEDPIEYELAGITQSQVHVKAGFTFENGLRSMLRQDPDIIMIGEIRDVPTANIAIEAALTGHLVVSTLHTNDAAGAITRLMDMGVEPFLISASLGGVVAQRLVRKLCEKCRQQIEPSEHERAALQALFPNEQVTQIFVAHGCSACFNLGHKGRLGVFELLLIDDRIKEMMLSKASYQEIKTYAIRQGMITLQRDALAKVQEGIISLEDLFSLLIH